MTERRGTKKPTGGTVGNHSIATKRAMIQPAQDDNALKRLSTALHGREQQLKGQREAFEEERRLLRAALDERQGELDKRDHRLSREKDAAAERTRKPAEVARMKVVNNCGG